MTNFEWLMTLSEEEFTDWVYDEWLHHLQYRWSSSRGGLIIWLKDRKTEPKPICESCSKNPCKKKKMINDIGHWVSDCTEFDRKTENSSEIPNNCEDEQTEPQTSCKTCRYGEVDEGYVRCAYYSKSTEQTEPQTEYKKWETKPTADIPTENTTCVGVAMALVEDEPQTDCAWK